MSLTIKQLRDQLNVLIDEGAGDAAVIFEEEGEGYFTDDVTVNTLMGGDNPTLTLLGAQSEQPEQHPDATRITLTPETHGQPGVVDLQQGDNLWIDIVGPDGTARLPRATSLFLDGNRLYFGFNSDTTGEWTTTPSVPVRPATTEL